MPPGTVRVTALARGAAIATHVHRFVRHLWVLAVAAILVVLVARPTIVPAAPILRNLAAIQINAVVENSSTVTAVAAKPAQTIVVQPGQTITALAKQYNISASTIEWGNQLNPTTAPKVGSTLLIPPGPGALVEVLPDETPTAFAKRVHLDPAVILEYNALTSNTPMTGGSYLQVPLTSRTDGLAHRRVFRRRAERGPGCSRSGPVQRRIPLRAVHVLRRHTTCRELERQRRQLVVERTRSSPRGTGSRRRARSSCSISDGSDTSPTSST